MQTAADERLADQIMNEVRKDRIARAHEEDWGQFECHFDHHELLLRLRKLCRGLSEARKRELALFFVREAFDAWRQGGEQEANRIRDCC